MKKSIIYIGVFVLNLALSRAVLSWDNKVTHRDLSEIASDNSVLSKSKDDYLKRLGFDKGLMQELKWGAKDLQVKKWLAEGADLEDAQDPLFPLYGTTRSFNHFHNPLNSWDQAGLNDTWTGKSSLLWAQDGAYQQGFPENDWSWQKTRLCYYYALIAQTKDNQQALFACTFRGLGHQIHLVQDTAVPDHVRNDAHPEDAIFGKNPFNGSAYFESWAKNNSNYINSLAANPIFPNVSFNVSYGALAPITQLYDTDEYNGSNPSVSLSQGLAEYTNANFFSGDTIFAAERYSSSERHYFPYPKKTSTDVQAYMSEIKPLLLQIAEDGIQDNGIWLKKERDGESIEHFVRASRWSGKIYKTAGEGPLFYGSFYRDDKCHEDYIQKLIPRAVSYSAGLLNYFFRGVLEITAPGSYLYSITDGSKVPQQFAAIKAKVKNTTPNEAMTEGMLQAVARYKIVPNYAPDLSNYPPDGTVMQGIPFSYSVSAPRTLLSEEVASMNVNPTEFTFDFTADPIPAGITDLYLQIVFKGTLGNEKDMAVAVGMKDLMEPTDHVFWNNTDMFSLYGHLYTAQQIRNDPNLLALASGAYIDPEEISLEFGYMGESPPLNPWVTAARVDNLPAGRHVRLILLVDRQADNYVRISWRSAEYPTEKHGDVWFLGAQYEDINGAWNSTPVTSFRTVIGHLSEGVVACKPLTSPCPYPEEEAIVPGDLTPYNQAIINFP